MIPIPFLQGQVYKRSRIHERFGGNPQSGISTCRDFIFIFSGRSGVQHGYRDQWENPDVFSYTGEGQVGDMKFTRGNLALRDHLKSGRRVLLFVQDARSFVRYESELEFLDFDYFLTTARDGKERRGIKFFFKRAGASLNYPIDQVHSALWLETGGQYVPDLPNTTERSGLVTSRVGQGAYRKSIL
ncbi:MAG TPA: hypothetical protein VMV20_08365, partial [Chitinophagaceae bacterium]|nr:hypothetical protein [Chitinophagaceae bacterium]